ncbi:MAG: hypothetical protein ACRCSV_05005 [Chlamydiales bacterium]
MMNLSILTAAISGAALATVSSAKKLCVESKVDALFHSTVNAIQSHRYISLLGATAVGVYCCRGKISGLVTKIIEVAGCLCTKTIESLRSVMNLFRQGSAPTEPKTNSEDLLPYDTVD